MSNHAREERDHRALQFQAIAWFYGINSEEDIYLKAWIMFFDEMEQADFPAGDLFE